MLINNIIFIYFDNRFIYYGNIELNLTRFGSIETFLRQKFHKSANVSY
jgi:hypothetical protein